MGVTTSAIRVYCSALPIFRNSPEVENGAPVVGTRVPSPIKHPPEIAIFQRLYRVSGTKQTAV